MKKILCVLAFQLCCGSCLSANIKVAGVSLDDLLLSNHKVKKYYEVLGRLDYALEDALIDVSRSESRSKKAARHKAKCEDEQRGRTVLSEHDAHEEGAINAYKGGVSLKSKAHGLPHAFGKHMQILRVDDSTNRAEIRPMSLNLYKYMSDNERLLDIYNMLCRKDDITQEKKRIIDVIMKYLTVANVLQNSHSFINATYKRENADYSGLAFFTDDALHYNAGNCPEVLFVPIRKAGKNRNAYVASLYPLGCAVTLRYKLNLDDCVKGNMRLEVKDVPANIKGLFYEPQAVIQVCAQDDTCAAEEGYKAIYRKTSNPLKIRVGRICCDVFPIYYDVNSVSESVDKAKQWIKEVNDIMQEFNDIIQEFSGVADECVKDPVKYKKASHCVDKISRLVSVQDENYKFAVMLRLVANLVQLSEIMPDKQKGIVRSYKEFLKNSSTNDKLKETQEERKKAIIYICAAREGFSMLFIQRFLDAIVTCNFLELFVECFYEMLNDTFFDTFPDVTKTLSGKAKQPFKMIARSKSVKFTEADRKRIRDEVKEQKIHSKMPSSYVKDDKRARKNMRRRDEFFSEFLSCVHDMLPVQLRFEVCVNKEGLFGYETILNSVAARMSRAWDTYSPVWRQFNNDKDFEGLNLSILTAIKVLQLPASNLNGKLLKDTYELLLRSCHTILAMSEGKA